MSLRRCGWKTCGKRNPKADMVICNSMAFCDFDHATRYGIEASNKLRAVKAKQESVRRKRECRAKLKTRSDWMKEAQKAFNRYIRARDYGKPCASCGSSPEQKRGGTMDCSHYRSVGSAPHMRFFVFNAASGCVRCNRELSGNVVELRKGLIGRFGQQRIESVEADETIRRFDIPYLMRVKYIFNKRAKLREDRIKL
jgi:hypothetical protein